MANGFGGNGLEQGIEGEMGGKSKRCHFWQQSLFVFSHVSSHEMGYVDGLCLPIKMRLNRR